MKKRYFYMFLLVALSFILVSCLEQQKLQPNEVAIINGDPITTHDVEDKLLSFQLEKILFEYSRFRDNIYPKLELLQLSANRIDHIVEQIKSGNIEEAKRSIDSLDLSQNRDPLKYFVLKEISRYEDLLSKQNYTVAFHEILKDKIILQEAKKRSLLPTTDEFNGAYHLYLSTITDNIENNIYSKYYYTFTKSKERELFQLDTDEDYANYLRKKIEYELTINKLKKEIGSYHFDPYIEKELKESTLVFNPKFSQYKNQ